MSTFYLWVSQWTNRTISWSLASVTQLFVFYLARIFAYGSALVYFICSFLLTIFLLAFLWSLYRVHLSSRFKPLPDHSFPALSLFDNQPSMSVVTVFDSGRQNCRDQCHICHRQETLFHFATITFYYLRGNRGRPRDSIYYTPSIGFSLTLRYSRECNGSLCWLILIARTWAWCDALEAGFRRNSSRRAIEIIPQNW